MDDQDKARILIRLARKCPEESPVLLAWAEELLTPSKNGRRSAYSHLSRGTLPEAAATFFPLPIFILTTGRKIDGILHEDCRVEVNGMTHRSVSGAAVAVLGHPEDGWRVWKFRDTDGRNKPIDVLRRRGLIGSPPVKRRRRS